MEATFRFMEGDFAQFRGQVFLYGKPTKVTDRATIDALRRNPIFEEIKDEAQEQETAEATVLNKDECPKCGRIVSHGKYMHQKYCKGRS